MMINPMIFTRTRNTLASRYLNEGWESRDGGELAIYEEDGEPPDDSSCGCSTAPEQQAQSTLGGRGRGGV
jgi:Rps23 Pro-64 3,4-dihydroxylase Tpa1-like proline 4-hydroxylase